MRAGFAGAVLICLGIGLTFAQGQTDYFRIGEKLTYNVSFGQLQSVAYGELYTVSRGKLSGRDAIELRSKLKTLGLVGAQFFTIDESRTTYVSPETGYPIFISKTRNNSVDPQETTQNFLTSPATSYDLLTLIAKFRGSGGSGSFNFSDNDRVYTVTLTPAGTERVKTGAGEFDSTVSTVDSTYLSENGITELKVYLSSDDKRLPVQFSFKAKTRKGIFIASLASVEVVKSDTDTIPDPTPTPIVVPTPVVIRIPTPTPTPLPYVENRPLSPDLPFELGETLDYRVTSGPRAVGVMTLSVKDRKLFGNSDSLLLSADVKQIEPGETMLDPKDNLIARVDPDLLSPQLSEFRLFGALSLFNRSERFDQTLGKVTFGPGNIADAPVGTQSLLSFLYAIRTFNLKQNRDLANPVNDTRVAVFWDSKAYIFTLRPTNATIDTPSGKKQDCVLISVTTRNPQLDALAIKVWLSTDARRLPLRITFGPYQADLIRP